MTPCQLHEPKMLQVRHIVFLSVINLNHFQIKILKRQNGPANKEVKQHNQKPLKTLAEKEAEYAAARFVVVVGVFIIFVFANRLSREFDRHNIQIE